MKQRKIYNFTQHHSTPEQVKDGVVDLDEENRKKLIKLLTFDELPTLDILTRRALDIADLATKIGAEIVLIGGVPFLMSHLEAALTLMSIKYVYSFSKRQSVEEEQKDGSVIKKTVFRHEGFVKGFEYYSFRNCME